MCALFGDKQFLVDFYSIFFRETSSCLKSNVEMKKLGNAADVVSFWVWTILLSIIIYIYFFYHENWEQRDDGKIGEKT